MHGEKHWEMGGEEGWPPRRGGRGHRRMRVFGPPGLMGPPWLGEPGGRRGPRVRRGDVRAAALALLAEEPRNGYQIIQEIGERSGGVWQPSPGSVYPALQQLEDEGLIQAEAPEGGRRHYTLTSEGREYVAAHPEEVRAPWEAVARSVGTDAIEMRRLFGEVVMAATQVARVGTDEQVTQAHQILTDARKKLYRILAADEGE
jgi:DNA-binding PadR family transcriptional regulator